MGYDATLKMYTKSIACFEGWLWSNDLRLCPLQSLIAPKRVVLETMITKYKGSSPMTFEIRGSLSENRGSVVVTWPLCYDLSPWDSGFHILQMMAREKQMTSGWLLMGPRALMGCSPCFYGILLALRIASYSTRVTLENSMRSTFCSWLTIILFPYYLQVGFYTSYFTLMWYRLGARLPLGVLAIPAKY